MTLLSGRTRRIRRRHAADEVLMCHAKLQNEPCPDAADARCILTCEEEVIRERFFCSYHVEVSARKQMVCGRCDDDVNIGRHFTILVQTEWLK